LENDNSCGIELYHQKDTSRADSQLADEAYRDKTLTGNDLRNGSQSSSRSFVLYGFVKYPTYDTKAALNQISRSVTLTICSESTTRGLASHKCISCRKKT